MLLGWTNVSSQNSSRFPPGEVEILSPQSHAYEDSVLKAAAVYSCLFLIGVCGISSVWAHFTSIFLRSRQILWPQQTIIQENVYFIYILALTAGDFCVLMTIPMLVSEMLLHTWVFGETLCKMYFFAESFGKLTSGFFLVAISFDRSLKVSRVTASCPTSVRFAVCLLLSLLGLATILLLPILIYSKVNVLSRSVPGFMILKYVCTLDWDYESTLVKIWNLTLCAISFVIPASLILIFYGRILCHLCYQKRDFPSSVVPMRKITAFVSVLVIFYLVCWAPFWVVQILFTQDTSVTNTTLNWIAKYTHFLPFVNSAFNWLFYALLNSQFRKEATGRPRKLITAPNSKSMYASVTIRDGQASMKLARKSLKQRNSASCEPAADLYRAVKVVEL